VERNEERKNRQIRPKKRFEITNLKSGRKRQSILDSVSVAKKSEAGKAFRDHESRSQLSLEGGSRKGVSSRGEGEGGKYQIIVASHQVVADQSSGIRWRAWE